MIKAGTYQAKITNHAISETKKGDPQATVSFSFEIDGAQHSLTWFGSFKEKALPITLKALVIMGLKGNNPAGPLEIGKDVLIVVDFEKDETTGKERNKISWVNALNSVRNVIPQDLAVSKLASLEGAVMMARQKLGVSDADEIPF